MIFNRRLNSLAFRLRAPFIAVIVSAVAGGFAVIGQAWVLSDILDQIHILQVSINQLNRPFLLLVFIIFLRAILVYVNEQNAALLSEKIRSALRERLAEKILRLGPAYTNQQQDGELAHVTTTGVDSLDSYFSQYLPQLVICAILPVSILIIVFPLDILSAFILLVTAPLIPVFMILIGRTTETLTHRQYDAFSGMSAFFHDSLRGLTELKNLGRSGDHASRLDRVSETYRNATLKVLRVAFLSAFVLELAATLSVAVIAVQIGIRLMYGQMDFQQAFFFLVIAPDFYLPLRQLGARFHAAQNGVSAAKRIFAILDEPEIDLAQTLSDNHPVSFPFFKGEFNIRYENVTFTYPGRKTDAVHRVSLTISSREKLAIVGLNGSGKSTLTSLLLRFIQPNEGCITWNGVDIQTIPIDKWREEFLYVNQQPALFNATIRENLTITAPSAEEHQLEQALQEAHLLETVKTLPAGMDTQLGEDAYGFSGGQAQRLVLARAFLKNAPFLILDEPTTHLDPITQADLDSSISRLQQGRTCVLIAHRRRTAQEADRVFMMDHGHLVGSGHHMELLDTCPSYANLFSREVF
ncbi:MAG: thiol reductant ABC exporter subunit CydD [Leptolinea sp.]|nr:thiol reductant ABC exporter subunit CydD [Leptolinea sp.]